MAQLAVHVTPKASREEILGWRGRELQVRVTTAPEGGKANAAVCSVVASALGIPKSRVRVVRGASARHKALDVDGIDDEALHSAFGSPDESLF